MSRLDRSYTTILPKTSVNYSFITFHWVSEGIWTQTSGEGGKEIQRLVYMTPKMQVLIGGGSHSHIVLE